jgi:hypothetical protein
MRNIAPFLIALVSPANESVINPGTLIDLDILVQSFDSVNYTINGGAYVDISEPFDIIADVTNWSEDGNRLDVYVTDMNMNVNSSWFYFIFDSLAPQISLVSPGNNSKIKAGKIIDMEIVESNMNFASVLINNDSLEFLLFPYDLNTTGWLDGEYNILIYAIDLSGTNSSRYYNFTIDSTEPAIILDSPGNNSFIRPGIPLDFSIVDNHLHTTWYTINGGTEQSFAPGYIIDTTTFLDGNYQIAVRANDSIGNVKISIFNISVDSTTPQIILNSPENNSVIREGEFVIFTVIDSSPVNFRFSYDSINEFILFPPYSINTTGLENVVYSIYLNVTDFAGNQNISWFNISIDSEDPIIYMHDLENNSYIQPGVQIRFIIIEPNLVYANYSLNDGGYNSLLSSTVIDTTGWPDGTYKIDVEAIDKTGNFFSEIFVLHVDTTPPQVVSTSPKNNEKSVPPENSISITFSEPMDDNSLLLALSIEPFINYTPRMTLDNLTLIINPEEKLRDNFEFTIVINSSATDRAGLSLDADYTFSFTTGEEEDDSSIMLLLLLILIIVVILVAVIFYLRKRRGKPSVTDDEKDEDDFALEDQEKPGKIDEDLMEEGLGEEDEDLPDDEIEDLKENKA